MLASTRWAEFFAHQLECVKCRKTHDLALYHFDGRPVDVENTSVEDLRALIPKMDVWCSECRRKVNTRVAGPGRLARKREASVVADLKLGHAPTSGYDRYLLDNGVMLTKHALVEAVKEHYHCGGCHNYWPSYVIEFVRVDGSKGRNISSLLSTSITVRELIEQMEQCNVFCSNCAKIVQHGDANAFGLHDGWHLPIEIDHDMLKEIFAEKK